MRQKGNSRPDHNREDQELLAARIDQALASFEEVELNLRNLRTNRLPQICVSLAVAASTVESLRSALAALGRGAWFGPGLMARMKQVEYAVGRVTALHRAAQEFHAGMTRIRWAEAAGYDSSGAGGAVSELQTGPHTLEARG